MDSLLDTRDCNTAAPQKYHLDKTVCHDKTAQTFGVEKCIRLYTLHHLRPNSVASANSVCYALYRPYGQMYVNAQSKKTPPNAVFTTRPCLNLPPPTDSDSQTSDSIHIALLLADVALDFPVARVQ